MVGGEFGSPAAGMTAGGCRAMVVCVMKLGNNR